MLSSGWNIDNAEKWFAKYFESNQTNELHLGDHEYTKDLRATVSSLIAYCKHNKDNKGFQPYYDKLKLIGIKLTKS